MADKPTFTLTEPIEVGGETITTVTLRPIKTKDMRKLRKEEDDFEASFQIVCAVTGLSTEQVDEMAAIDFSEIAEAAMDFLPEKASSPTTSNSGDPSSQTSPAS